VVFWYPAFRPTDFGYLLSALFTSPLGLLPHHTIAIVCILAAVGGKNSPALICWGSVLGAIFLGIFEFIIIRSIISPIILFTVAVTGALGLLGFYDGIGVNVSNGDKKRPSMKQPLQEPKSLPDKNARETPNKSGKKQWNLR